MNPHELIEQYAKFMDFGKPLTDRIMELLKGCQPWVADEVEDVLVCDAFSPDGTRAYTELVFFTQSVIVFFPNFVSDTSQMQITAVRKPAWSDFKRMKTTIPGGSVEQTIVRIHHGGTYQYSMWASGENVKRLIQVWRKFILPRMQPS